MESIFKSTNAFDLMYGNKIEFKNNHDDYGDGKIPISKAYLTIKVWTDKGSQTIDIHYWDLLAFKNQLDIEIDKLKKLVKDE